MAGWDNAGTIHAKGLRIAQLAANGAPTAGPNLMGVTNAFTRVTLSPDVRQADAIERVDAAGNQCLFYEPDPTLRRYGLTLELCSLNPEMESLLDGSLTLMQTTTVVGAQSKSVGETMYNPLPISLEFWQREIVNGVAAPLRPWAHFILPYVRLRKGDTNHGNEATFPTYTGYAYENPNWGNGPADDWVFASTKTWAWARDGSTPAAATDGLVPIAAQVP